jgi:predicted transcriptional regulator
MRGNHVKTQDVVVMYTEKHLTMAEIGRLVGITRQGVLKHLRKAGIEHEQGTFVEVGCDLCGAQFRKRRGAWKRSREHFCSRACLHASLENPGYKPWRQGQRLAVAIVSQYHKLEQGEIVHHKDGDNRNNDRSNLAVYANHSDHLKAHHGKTPVVPVWDGALVR